MFISPDTAGKNTIRLTTNAGNDGRILIKSDTTTTVDIQANGVSYLNGGQRWYWHTSAPNAPLTVWTASSATSQAALRLNNPGGFSSPLGRRLRDNILVRIEHTS